MLFVLRKCDKGCKMRSFKNTPSPCLRGREKKEMTREGRCHIDRPEHSQIYSAQSPISVARLLSH